KPAMLVVGGWYDAENLYGALHSYQAIEQNNPGTVNMLVMGPWSHGQWGNDDGEKLGDINFGAKTAAYYLEHIELPFFNHYLKDHQPPELAEAMMFETGGNVWRFFKNWPPAEANPAAIYLHGDGGLRFEPPSASGEVFRQYLSDPDKPVPYTAEIRHWYNPAFMLEDQRFAARRPDVLVYESAPLTADICAAGPITATLFVSTSGTDSDWIVKVIDVFPENTPDPDPNPRNVKMGGYQQLVRGDVIRGKFRNSLAQPEPFEPGKITKVEFVLQDVLHRFKQGHRLMVQIQSTWFPMIDRNPQKFVDIFNAQPGDFQTATQRVYSSAEYPSRITLRILPGDGRQ
ncbi:MAG: CocE/NonD family hydrolase, partial [candidate division KSB1 bacterium]|nr:CocE/NonD family hydrolase [candidate division KSB1 bacterium]